MSRETEFIAGAIERFKECEDAGREIREQFIEDVKFASGDHYPKEVVDARKGKPMLVCDRISHPIRQVCNQQRQNREQIIVRPKGGGAKEERARFYEGMFRHIQSSSRATSAIDTAFDYAVSGGIGFFRINTRYEDDISFNQCVDFDRIEDPSKVYFPFHLCHEEDFSDSPYAFVVSDLPKKEFDEENPDHPGEWSCATTGMSKWLPGKTVRIAEYFVKEKKKTGTMYLLADGSIVPDVPEGAEVKQQRDTYETTIKWYKLTGAKILKQGEFPGRYIPIIPIIGEEKIVDGKKKFISLTRRAKDPQFMFDLMKSFSAEVIAYQPKSPFVAAAGQLDGHPEWKEANVKAHAALEYNAVLKVNGVDTIFGPPQREMPPQLSPALETFIDKGVDDIKAALGMFDASQGSQGNETSGRAINARKMQSDTSNYHFFDHKSKAMQHAGRLIIAIIPEVYDTEREVSILGEDMKELVVTINSEFDDEGQKRIGKLSLDEQYDVLIDTGPAYATKRQETADFIAQLGQSVPQIATGMMDITCKYLDMPLEIVERAQKIIAMMMPAVMEGTEQSDVNQMKAQLAQYQQIIQQLDMVIQQMSAEADQTKAQLAGKQMDNVTREKIAALQAQVNVLVAQIRASAEHEKLDKTHSHEVGMESMRNAHNIFNGTGGSAQNQPSPQPGANPEI